MTETAARRNYKSTLNLPRTSFPMRARLADNEPASLERWSARNLYDEIQKARAGAEPFVFHDGPPFASGALHAGHLVNKVLKDIVVRSRLMAGRSCRFVPGWDCHGLPIEHRVMTDLIESGEAAEWDGLDDDARRMEVRRRCRASAEHFVGLQSTQMLGGSFAVSGRGVREIEGSTLCEVGATALPPGRSRRYSSRNGFSA